MNLRDISAPVRSNLEHWKEMQEQDYFEAHPCYKGLNDVFPGEVALIESFTPLRQDMNVVVIGCGYGRESAHIAPRVRHLWGIDVSERILEKAASYLASRDVSNFTPVLAERYVEEVPSGIDLVFSIVVMQHLTRDLVRQYFRELGAKLSPDGVMLVQFLESFGQPPGQDAELKTYEPSVSWTSREIAELASASGLAVRRIRTDPPQPTYQWHWAFLGR